MAQAQGLGLVRQIFLRVRVGWHQHCRVRDLWGRGQPAAERRKRSSPRAAAHPILSIRRARGHVHHLAHVDGTDLRCTISALFGLTNGIIDQQQYTILVAAVIGSAVVPTLIAQQWFMPQLTPAEEGARAGERSDV